MLCSAHVLVSCVAVNDSCRQMTESGVHFHCVSVDVVVVWFIPAMCSILSHRSSCLLNFHRQWSDRVTHQSNGMDAGQAASSTMMSPVK